MLYNPANPKSIEEYSKSLIGLSFSDVIDAYYDRHLIVKEESQPYGNEDKSNKGNLGQIIEKYFFEYDCNSDSNADFSEAGVELKVSPYKKNNNGALVAKERLILSMIDYFKVIDEEFETSHLWNKCKLILLIYYLYEEKTKNRIDYKINYSSLFTPDEKDLAIIKNDFKIIADKVKKGLAHELSEADTMYLSAATKSSSSAIRREQPNSDIPAKPRAFAYKNSYMTYVLNNYIIPGRRSNLESIIKDTNILSFEEYVVRKINKYKGYSTDALCREFGISSNAKSLGAIIAYKILGINGNKAEEFEKANIKVKTIRVEENNRIKESMSFPTFKFKELVEEEWEESEFGSYLKETKFLFVIYKFDKEHNLILKGCQFWNMPLVTIEEQVKPVWEKTKSVLLDGLKVTVDAYGKKHNNFPKASENSVCHVRPHAQNSKDTYELPNGEQYPKQCFWLNNSYIYEQLDESFKC